MLKVGKFDVLKVSKYIDTKSIRIGSDTDLYITPTNKMVVQSNESEFDLGSKFLLFIEKENQYGFGIYIDKNEVQVGYGTKANFQSHNLLQGLIITQDSIIGPTIETTDTEAIPLSEIDNMIEAIYS